MYGIFWKGWKAAGQIFSVTPEEFASAIDGSEGALQSVTLCLISRRRQLLENLAGAWNTCSLPWRKEGGTDNG